MASLTDYPLHRSGTITDTTWTQVVPVASNSKAGERVIDNLNIHNQSASSAEVVFRIFDRRTRTGHNLFRRTLDPYDDIQLSASWAFGPLERLDIRCLTASRTISFHCSWLEKLVGT